MSNKINHTKVLLWVAIPVFVIMILLIIIQWCTLHKNIQTIKTQNETAYNKILNAKTNGVFQIEFTKLSKQQVVIDPKEIEKINNHINALTESVQKEVNRAESTIDKDIDRLNLYMAIGIGFMTLLGIFVPIMVNVLSVQDLRDKQNTITEDLNQFKTEIPKIQKATEDAQKASKDSSEALKKSKELDGMSSKINDVELKAKKVFPHLNDLILQNVIARFFNISSIVITNAIRTNDFNDFIDLLEAIKNSFTACKNDSDHTIQNNSEFKNTIHGFVLFLETERFRFQTIFKTREENSSFEDLIECLKKLKTSNEQNVSSNYDTTTNQIDNIISIIRKKYVTTQSAA